jgi:hypothetical protein
MDKMRVLDISKQQGVAASLFKDAEIVSLAEGENIPDELFDIVFCHHIVNKIERKNVLPFVKMIAGSVKPMGELWISVPSAEAACKSILLGEDSPIPIIALYGENEVFRCCLTLGSLRNLVEATGLISRRATQNTFTVFFNEKEYDYPQNLVIAFRRE